mgnify:CR=1 FL=1
MKSSKMMFLEQLFLGPFFFRHFCGPFFLEKKSVGSEMKTNDTPRVVELFNN